MIEKILYWIKGYIVLQLQNGDLSRLLNLCKVNEIQLLDVQQSHLQMLFHLSKKNYEKILPFIEKCHVDAEIVKQIGFLSFVKKYRKRLIFFLCGVLFIIILLYTSKFIWHISVDGESFYTEEEVVSYVEENHIPLGTKIQSIHISDLERELREYFNHVAWVTCEIKGTNLKIHMVETISPNNIPKETEPCNIVAIKAGLVTDLFVTCGRKVVDTGTEVKKGDILITGVVNIQNEYEEVMETTYVSASGKVYGKTTYTYSQEIPLNSTEKYYTGKRKTCYIFDILGKQFQIKHPKYDKNYDIETESKKLKLFNNYYLPICLSKNTYHEFEYKSKNLTLENAIKKQNELLDIYMDGLRKKNVEILQNNVTIDCVDGVSIASGTIVVKELIGVPETFMDFQ